MASKYACGDMMTNSHLKPTMMIMMITMMTMIMMIMMITMIRMITLIVMIMMIMVSKENGMSRSSYLAADRRKIFMRMMMKIIMKMIVWMMSMMMMMVTMVMLMMMCRPSHLVADRMAPAGHCPSQQLYPTIPDTLKIIIVIIIIIININIITSMSN